ncbi:hypothetical protein [Sphingomonas desiccabilis]|nr:hypothetical protein [Sphingomonas desiccabilis]
MAWVTAVFLPSVLIAYFGISPAAAAISVGFDRLPATSWKVADDVGPAVKLMIGGLLLLGLLGLSRARGLSPSLRSGGSAAVGMIAVTATIGMVPLSLSRGFAGALTGTAFDWWTTAPLGAHAAAPIERQAHRHPIERDSARSQPAAGPSPSDACGEARCLTPFGPWVKAPRCPSHSASSA